MANNQDLKGRWDVTVTAPIMFRREGSRGRKTTFKPGDKLWIQNRDYNGSGHIMVGRDNQPLGAGYLFTRESFDTYFIDR